MIGRSASAVVRLAGVFTAAQTLARQLRHREALGDSALAHLGVSRDNLPPELRQELGLR